MTQVLIISKTRKGKTGICIGGVTLPDLVSVRIMQSKGEYHNINTEYDIGQIWEMEYTKAPKLIPPHVENVWVQKKKLIKKINEFVPLINDAKLKALVWKGHPRNLFDEKLRWTGTRHGFLEKSSGISSMSTGFWIPDRDLKYRENYYYYDDEKGNWNSVFGFKYVGVEKPIEIIPVKTRVRVSLATWWVQDGVELPLRCYLQLSGWYLK